MWTRSTLALLVSVAGHLVRLDPATELLIKGRYARVAMEINLSRPLVLAPMWLSRTLIHLHFGKDLSMNTSTSFVGSMAVSVSNR